MALHWAAVTAGRRGMAWGEFVAQIASLPAGQLWRHNQAGDLPGDGDDIDGAALAQLVAANRGRRGFTYTHKPVSGNGSRETMNRAAVRFANQNGFAVNLSANSPAHADELAATGLPVVCVVPQDAPSSLRTPGGRAVVVCPAQRDAGRSCADCGICQNAGRGFVVGFRAHGSSARKVEEIARAV